MLKRTFQVSGLHTQTPVAVRTERLLSLPFGAMLSKKWKLTALIISLSLSGHSFIPCDETLESMRRKSESMRQYLHWVSGLTLQMGKV